MESGNARVSVTVGPLPAALENLTRLVDEKREFNYGRLALAVGPRQGKFYLHDKQNSCGSNNYRGQFQAERNRKSDKIVTRHTTTRINKGELIKSENG